MPGIRKTVIAERVLSLLNGQGCSALALGFLGFNNDLPWACGVTFADGRQRRYNIYFWTVSHGGKRRPEQEYRIQMKLKADRSLRFEPGTTLLIGYYHNAHDLAGSSTSPTLQPEIEVFVAWDPIHHLAVAGSSSCQVSYDLIQQGYIDGVAASNRRCHDGAVEMVIAFRPELLCRYLKEAAGGHNCVTAHALRTDDRDR